MVVEYGIRNATIGDGQGLAQLAHRGFKGYPFESVYQPQSLVDAITQGEIRIVAALKPELQHIIGTAVLGIDGFMAEIKRVIVHPEYRNNHLASNMTKNLERVAKRKKVHPYTDTRADQLGMQKASLGAGLKAITIESGKHVVYDHEVDVPGPGKEQLGPARESMIHMTSLRADQSRLYDELKNWPLALREKLYTNIAKALHNPAEKNKSVVEYKLPSALKVRTTILNQLEEHRNGFEIIHDEQDITVVQHGNVKITIIKPDASGFIETNDHTTNEEIQYILGLSEAIGLQIITSYENVKDVKKAQLMDECGLTPAMIRPWQTTKKGKPIWQAGFRKTMNGYEDCLHSIRLDKKVREQLEEFATTLKDKIL
jgi:hypothetical protein